MGDHHHASGADAAIASSFAFLPVDGDCPLRLLEAFAGALPGVIYAKDLAGRMLAVNRGAADLLGRTPAECLGKTDAELLADEAAAQAIMATDRRIMDTGTAEQVEERVDYPDGTTAIWLSTKSPLRDAAGHVVGLIGSSTDITERKATELALREETRALEALTRAGEMLAGELDLERLVQSLTDAGVEITGARFGAFFHNVLDESGKYLHLFTLSGARQEDFAGLGGVRPTHVFAPTLANAGVVRSDDILSDSRYGQMGPHHGMPKGHLAVRSYMAVPVASRSGEVLGGLLFGHPEPGRFTERHERLTLALAAQAAIAIDNARLFQDVQRANETLEARVAERTAELLETQEALQQVQKMDAMGQLTGGVAHDFNNLLTPIVASLDILQRKLPDERSTRLIAGALHSAERAKTLVQRLLAFARRQTLEPQAIDPARLIVGMRELLDRSLGPRIEVDLRLPANLPAVLVDPNQLELALLNLSVNARDAMPGGGQLIISATEGDLMARDRTTQALELGRYVGFSVTDTGIGMDAETLKRAVEPFFTTKETGQGTGLGLSMVHGLAAQSGGHFDLRSRPGEGTTAVLWIPVAPAPAVEPAPPEAALPTAPRGSLVLLVDDEELVREATAEGLRELGYEVVEVGTAANAIELVRRGLRPDALVTDHMMPGMLGADLAADLLARLPKLAVLMITGYANLPPERTRGIPVLSKPFRQAEIATVLAGLLDRRAPESNVVPWRPNLRTNEG